MNRSLTIAIAAVLLWGAAAARPALAASCCGGANGADAFTLPKFMKAMAGSGIASEMTYDVRAGDGERVHAKDWNTLETKLTFGGAYRIADDWQTGWSLPAVLKSVSAGTAGETGYGIGDASGQLRYEFIDEETCILAPVQSLKWNDLKPSIHGFARATLPSGRTTGESMLPLGGDVTGRGLWVAEAGLDVTKVWGRWGNTLSGAGGWQSAYHGRDATQPAGARWNAGAGVLFFLSYKHSLSLRIDHRRETPNGVQATGTSLGYSKIFENNWWLRAGVNESGLIQGVNTPVSVGGSVQVSKLF